MCNKHVMFYWVDLTGGVNFGGFRMLGERTSWGLDLLMCLRSKTKVVSFRHRFFSLR